MPPQKGNATQKGAPLLQALLICDSFHGGFLPVSGDIPEILFPICNVPLLHYTLEFLTQQPVSEIFVVSAFKPAMVWEYLVSSQWKSWESPKITFHPIRSVSTVSECISAIGTAGFITTDFIFVHGGVVTNIDMTPIIEFHRKNKDDSTLGTFLFTRAPKMSNYNFQEVERAMQEEIPKSIQQIGSSSLKDRHGPGLNLENFDKLLTTGQSTQHALKPQHQEPQCILGYDRTTGRLNFAQWRGFFASTQFNNPAKIETPFMNLSSMSPTQGLSATPPSTISDDAIESKTGQSSIVDVERFPKTGLTVRSDLVPCWVGVCSHTFPTHFSQTYDFSTLPAFIDTALDMPGDYRLYVKEVDGGIYCRSVFNLEQLRAVNEDVLCRRCHPVTPDLQATRPVPPRDIYFASIAQPPSDNDSTPTTTMRNTSSSSSTPAAVPPAPSPRPRAALKRFSSSLSLCIPPALASSSQGPATSLLSMSSSAAQLSSSLTPAASPDGDQKKRAIDIIRSFDSSLGKYRRVGYNNFVSMDEPQAMYASLRGPALIGKGAKIGSECRIEGSVIGPGCVLGRGAVVLRSVLWNNVHVGAYSCVIDSMVCSYAHILTGSLVSHGSVVGFFNSLKPYTVLQPNSALPSDTPLHRHHSSNSSIPQLQTAFSSGALSVHEISLPVPINGVTLTAITTAPQMSSLSTVETPAPSSPIQKSESVTSIDLESSLPSSPPPDSDELTNESSGDWDENPFLCDDTDLDDSEEPRHPAQPGPAREGLARTAPKHERSDSDMSLNSDIELTEDSISETEMAAQPAGEEEEDTEAGQELKFLSYVRRIFTDYTLKKRTVQDCRIIILPRMRQQNQPQVYTCFCILHAIWEHAASLPPERGPESVQQDVAAWARLLQELIRSDEKDDLIYQMSNHANTPAVIALFPAIAEACLRAGILTCHDFLTFYDSIPNDLKEAKENLAQASADNQEADILEYTRLVDTLTQQLDRLKHTANDVRRKALGPVGEAAVAAANFNPKAAQKGVNGARMNAAKHMSDDDSSDFFSEASSSSSSPKPRPEIARSKPKSTAAMKKPPPSKPKPKAKANLKSVVKGARSSESSSYSSNVSDSGSFSSSSLSSASSNTKPKKTSAKTSAQAPPAARKIVVQKKVAAKAFAKPTARPPKALDDSFSDSGSSDSSGFS